MQRLRSAKRCGHGFDRGADHIIVRVLHGQGHARRLAVGAQHFRAIRFGPEISHDLRPHLPSGSKFSDLHKHVHTDTEKERQTSGKGVHVQSLSHSGADIFHTVSERIGQLLGQGRAGFLHVIAGNGNGIKFWHLRRCIFNNITDNFHARLRWIDVGVAHHKLFENVVLDSSGELG